MTTVVIEGLEADQLVEVGDALLQLGKRSIALAVYRAAAQRVGLTGAIETRIGLARIQTPRTLPSLAVLDTIEKGGLESAYVGEGLATWMKSSPFLEDPHFMELIQKHAPLLPLPNWHWNLQTVAWAARQVRQIEGDFVELGVFKGHTTAFVSDLIGFGEWPKRWFLYDTFSGVPDDQLDPGWAKVNTEAYRGTFSYEEVAARFAETPNIEVIKGRVPEVLAERSPERIAFLHVDMNNATAEVQALDALFDRVSPGGVIVFDDYAWIASTRQRHAEDAWLAERGYRVLPLPTGQGLVVKR